MLKKQLPPDAPLARRTLLKGATLRVGAGPRSLARWMTPMRSRAEGPLCCEVAREPCT
jgi:hypothetical protein